MRAVLSTASPLLMELADFRLGRVEDGVSIGDESVPEAEVLGLLVLKAEAVR